MHYFLLKISCFNKDNQLMQKAGNSSHLAKDYIHLWAAHNCTLQVNF